jgi:hypothetical protein
MGLWLSFIKKNKERSAMSKIVRIDNGAPKFSPEDNKPKKIKVGLIAAENGGICWVRDELRQDPELPIIPAQMSDYWYKVSKGLFMRW